MPSEREGAVRRSHLLSPGLCAQETNTGPSIAPPKIIDHWEKGLMRLWQIRRPARSFAGSVSRAGRCQLCKFHEFHVGLQNLFLQCGFLAMRCLLGQCCQWKVWPIRWHSASNRRQARASCFHTASNVKACSQGRLQRLCYTSSTNCSCSFLCCRY